MDTVAKKPRQKQRTINVGDRIGRLIVIGESFVTWLESRAGKVRLSVCQCDCGTVCVVRTANLPAAKTVSCGCRRKELGTNLKQHPNYRTCAIHGGKGTKLYGVWLSMRKRCSNKKWRDYFRYGGRGIRVCEEWRNDFVAFRDWALANGYREGLSLDRYPNNDGNYEPSNCRWTTSLEQGNNKRNNHQFEAFGETKTIGDWSRDQRCVVSYQTLGNRIRGGWNPEEALTVNRKGEL